MARKYKDNRRVELILGIAFPNAKHGHKWNKWNETRRNATVFPFSFFFFFNYIKLIPGSGDNLNYGLSKICKINFHSENCNKLFQFLHHAIEK